jgi:hypothetical protein
MKLEIWEQDGEWGWSIFDGYGDEVSASTNMFHTKQEARQEAYAALEDYRYEN